MTSRVSVGQHREGPGSVRNPRATEDGKHAPYRRAEDRPQAPCGTQRGLCFSVGAVEGELDKLGKSWKREQSQD